MHQKPKPPARRSLRARHTSRGCVALLPLGAALACAQPTPPAQELTLGVQGQALTVSATAIGTEPAAAVQYHTGSYLATAAGTTTNLVVFWDGGRIRGMRYDAAGAPLDLHGWLKLGRDLEGGESYPDLAFGAGVFLVVYSEAGEPAPGLYARAVSEAGELLSEPVLVDPNGGYGAVVFNGTDFTVASYSGDIHLARVALDGSLVAGSSVAVTTSGVNNRPQLAMTASGEGLVVFEQATDGETRGVYGARFTAAGEVLDPGGLLLSDTTTSSVNVSVAAGVDGFLAVWSSNDRSAVYGSLVGTDGSVTAREAPLSRSLGDVGGSAVTFDGTDYLVAWEDASADQAMVFATHITPTGEHVEASDVALAGPSRILGSWDIDLHWTGDAYALAYASDGIFGGFFDRTLTPLGPERFGLTTLPGSQGPPVTAFDGTNFVIAYSDERDELSPTFRSVRLAADGSLVDKEGISVSGDGEQTYGGSLASNQLVTLFSWTPSGTDDVYVRVRDAEGALSAPEYLRTGGGGTLVSNGDTFVNLFSAGDNGVGNDNEVWGQALDSAGAVTGEPFKLVTISRPRGGAIRFGDEYLYAYSGQAPGGEPIAGNTLSFTSDGTVTAEYGPVVEGMLTAGSAAGDDFALYSWQVEDETLWGRLLHKDDGFGEPFQLSPALARYAPAIGWDGSQFVVVWSEDQAALWTLNVQGNGNVSEPERLLEGDYSFETITPGPDNTLLLTYIKWGEWSRSRRVESRFLGDAPVVVEEAPETPDMPADNVIEDGLVAPDTGDDNAPPDAPAGPAEPTPASPAPRAGAGSTESDLAAPQAAPAYPATTDSGADQGADTTDDGFCALSDLGRQAPSRFTWLSLGAVALLRRARKR